ncbi:MAG: oxidoreductase [Chitinophagaceae bacterium]|nr:oxidoreductase [Chitinophagaceae bacterium]
MATKKTIAIIGASGNMGSAIAKSLANAPYRILLFGKEEAKLKSLFKEIKNTNKKADAEIIGCAADASWEADIIIAAVPFAAEKDIAEKIRQVATGKIVISISNPLNETYTGLVTSSDTSSAEELQKLLPHSKVIKAFNTTFAGDFSQPVINGKTIDAFIAGNDEEALETVSDVVRSAGFNPIKAGALAVSRTLENMQSLLIQLSIKNNYNQVAGWKILHN